MSDRPLLSRPPDERVQLLDDDGYLLDDAAEPDLSDERLVTMYEQLVLSRHLDERAISLQRQGRMGTYPSLAGQEAAQVASAHGMADDDWLLYQYREHGAVAARELAPEYLLYWMGHEIGNEWLAERHVFPLNISIAGHIPHATGMAWASKLKGESKAFVCHFGDGSTSEGDFHEGLNFAGVFDVPAVFFCNNNQWAISIPRERQTASETIAQKARAYGFDGVQVDGMDPLAVYQVTREAVEKAKHPDDDELRPTLVEAVQYRFGAHTTADDPSVYRKEAEVEEWRRKDPIPRLETFLRERGLLDDEQVDAIEAAVAEEVADLVEAAEEFEPDPEQLFENADAEATPRVREQRAYFQALRERHGDDALLDEH